MLVEFSQKRHRTTAKVNANPRTGGREKQLPISKPSHSTGLHTIYVSSLSLSRTRGCRLLYGGEWYHGEAHFRLCQMMQDEQNPDSALVTALFHASFGMSAHEKNRLVVFLNSLHMIVTGHGPMPSFVPAKRRASVAF